MKRLNHRSMTHTVMPSGHSRRDRGTWFKSGRRQGFSIVEMIVSAILLGVVLTTTVPLLGWAAGQRHASRQRQFALNEVANVMEQLTLRSWETVTKQSAREIELSEPARAYLTDGRLTVAVSQPKGGPPAKRITVELSWKNRAGEFVSPASLTAWIYQIQEAK